MNQEFKRDLPLPHYAVRTLKSPGLSYNQRMIPQEENLQKSTKTDTETGEIPNTLTIWSIDSKSQS